MNQSDLEFNSLYRQREQEKKLRAPPSAGKLASSHKGGKTCNRRQHMQARLVEIPACLPLLSGGDWKKLSSRECPLTEVTL